MSEVAEDIEDGLRCQECGNYITSAVASGAGPGHPQTCSTCKPQIYRGRGRPKGSRNAQSGKDKAHG